MPEESKLQKAMLHKIEWIGQEPKDLYDKTSKNPSNKPIKVQFNPETLKVTYSNQISGADQGGGSTIQFINQSTTKMSVQLWFDVTAPDPHGNDEQYTDVHDITKKIAEFLQPLKKVEIPPGEGEQEAREVSVPPGISFRWGSFRFDGVMNSMDETIEYFSEDGIPLRASISLSITSQEIKFRPNSNQPGSPDNVPGTQPLRQAQAGDTFQNIAGRSGRLNNWQRDALDNGVENPRSLAPGTLLNFNRRR